MGIVPGAMGFKEQVHLRTMQMHRTQGHTDESHLFFCGALYLGVSLHGPTRYIY